MFPTNNEHQNGPHFLLYSNIYKNQEENLIIKIILSLNLFVWLQKHKSRLISRKRSLCLVKLKTSSAFLKINSISDIYSEFCKILWATISREALLLLIWLVLLFCEKNLITRKSVFLGKLLLKCGTRTSCPDSLKKDTIIL